VCFINNLKAPLDAFSCMLSQEIRF
jgi:hypothetical protein